MEEHFTERLPKKRMAAGALFFDGSGRILIVKPTYRPEWLVPGGVVEHGESPLAACAREIREELGLALDPRRLLCLDYQSADADGTEALHFVFLGGVLSPDQIARITPPPAEITEHRFVGYEEAMTRLDPPLARRIALSLAALDADRTVYAEDGHERPPLDPG